jgi:hypothetical protein
MSIAINGKVSTENGLKTRKLKSKNGFEDSIDKATPNGDSSLITSLNGKDSNRDIIVSSSLVISSLSIHTNDSEHSPLSVGSVTFLSMAKYLYSKSFYVHLVDEVLFQSKLN